MKSAKQQPVTAAFIVCRCSPAIDKTEILRGRGREEGREEGEERRGKEL
jgi:hypothetical protein